MIRKFTFCWMALTFVISALAQAPLPVVGVNDRVTYTDSISFAVPATPGHTYLVLFDGARIPTDVTNSVTVPDYHEISIWRTNVATMEVTNRVVRFAIQSSNRGSSERGLPVWTPYPPIPSTGEELAGAELNVFAPQVFPHDLDIPVIALLEDGAGRVRRVNGWVSAPGFESSDFRLLRGHGFGFLLPAGAAGDIIYNPRLPGIESFKLITIESDTVWTTVSGSLPENAVWPPNSRIHVTGDITVSSTGSLTVGAGTIVKLNPRVNIIGNGRIEINGTLQQPAVFTSTQRVAPEQHTFAWGGFLLRGSSAQLIARGAIMTGSGGTEDFEFDPSESHRSEQALLLVHSGARAFLTNCFLINHAGQIGNGYNSDVTFDHCLIQRAITAGEYVGGTIIVNHSAIIEFPIVDGTYSTSIAEADYDGIYFTTGTHILRDSLIGFAKDDAIDSGSGGTGTVLMTNCWVESALHEALAWSGTGRRTWTYDTVIMNSGQGIEAGWTTSNPGSSSNITPPSPDVFAERLLTTANAVGARFGDNYDWGYRGFLRLTNSLILYNARDVFAKTWNTSGTAWDTNQWVDRLTQMDLRSNYVSTAYAQHPHNAIWDPARDAARLEPFMTTPADAAVGVGLATWQSNYPMQSIFAGVPVRLSSFTTNFVTVNYMFTTQRVDVVYPEVVTLHEGTITFTPGETVKHIYPAGFDLAGRTFVRLALTGSTGGELTGETNVTFGGATPAPNISLRVTTGQQRELARIAEGVPVGLNAFAAQAITLDYRFETASGLLEEGTVTVEPATRLAWITPPEVDLEGIDLIRFSVSNPDGAPLNGVTNVYFVKTEAVVTPPSVTFIGRSAPNWRYLDTGVNLGNTWRSLDYGEPGWKTGAAQLGYGESDQATTVSYGPDSENKYITTYFRRTFVVTNPAAFIDLSMWLLRDDGGIVYLNNTEVFRSPNMPQGGVDYRTPANSGGENTVDQATLNAALLVPGTNVVAVEIHQDDPDSSDISFDFELIGNVAPIAQGPQPIRFGVFDGQLTMVWTDTRFVLEEADDVTGPWNEVSSGSPAFVEPSATRKFYRLRR